MWPCAGRAGGALQSPPSLLATVCSTGPEISRQAAWAAPERMDSVGGRVEEIVPGEGKLEKRGEGDTGRGGGGGMAGNDPGSKTPRAGVLGLGDERGLPWWLRRNGRNAMREAEAPKAHFSADPVLRCGWIQGHQDSTPPYFLTFLQGTYWEKGGL